MLITLPNVLRITLLTAAAILLSAFSAISAQQTASAAISAEVLSRPLTVTKLTDLRFGDVMPGTPKSIAARADEAAQFMLTGVPSAHVSVTFGLPGALTNGASQLPIGNWKGAYSTSATLNSGTSFTPSTSPTEITLGSGGVRYLGVGATVDPPITLPGGSYTGTLSITIAYL